MALLLTSLQTFLSFFLTHTETRDYKLIVSGKPIFQNNPPIITIVPVLAPKIFDIDCFSSASVIFS